MGSLLELSAAIERRDPYTLGHSARVTAVALALAARLACSAEETAAIALGGPLHDIGKLAIPDRVLQKPAKLDEGELVQIRRHPAAGARMLRGVASLAPALPCVLYHHERWDGRGYPHRLCGPAIPRCARILAVADAFDAMTSTRPYRAAMALDVALGEVRRCAGTQFDPEPAAALADVVAAELPALSAAAAAR